MPIQKFFSTPLYSDKLRESKLRAFQSFNSELLDQCYRVRDTDDEGREWSAAHYVHGYTSYSSLTHLHRHFPHFEELARDLNRHARKFARALEWDLQGGRLELTTCWINIMPTHAAHSLHLHPLSVLSGTYYVHVPKGASPIKFEDPRHSRFMAAPPKKANAKTPPFIHVGTRTGTVLLWESWLRHEVPVNLSAEDRVSISFNYGWV